MTDEEEDIKSMLKLLIGNIDVFDSKLVTYKAESMKILLKDILEHIEQKEQEYEKLRQYHNKCCKENIEKLEQWLEKYNQLSRDFYNGEYCSKEKCNLLKVKEQAFDEIELICRQALDDENVRPVAKEILKITEKENGR